ncbi:hypothetical protein K443DRAFT_15033 [Laccaria amethystina LaAM-08-1]|uniref:Uncharacterized protein n=1 Tax=Laccaria amethystina LaAM-08-1 TaxID=1095629 RepID=A0A0C9WRV3_9AGAR|nr:hypothetical protein K443DRAFT_15033 [Laccaria amethystina LaAM-08-1]
MPDHSDYSHVANADDERQHLPPFVIIQPRVLHHCWQRSNQTTNDISCRSSSSFITYLLFIIIP